MYFEIYLNRNCPPRGVFDGYQWEKKHTPLFDVEHTCSSILCVGSRLLIAFYVHCENREGCWFIVHEGDVLCFQMHC